MNLDLAKRWTRRWEGTRRCVYHDTKGIPTIGVGCNLTTDNAKNCLELMGLSYAGVLVGTISLTDSHIDTLLEMQLGVSSEDAHALVPNFFELPETQQIVVNDLSFNMGKTVLAKFVHTLAFIKDQKWSDAAANLKLSSWYIQVKQRGVANVAVLGNTATIESFL
jgi:GH24 family phage-related lysozyme (muramidase)